jgi:hypothetical protein
MHRLVVFSLFLVGAVSGTHCEAIEPVIDSSQRMPKGIPAGVEIKLVADNETYFLGENILLHYEVKNTGTEPIMVELGGDYRGAPRHTRFHVVATDEAGSAMDDPTPSPQNHGGFGGGGIIKPGETLFESVPIMRYCLFENPGKYTIRIAHDLGWSENRSGYKDEPFTESLPI